MQFGWAGKILIIFGICLVVVGIFLNLLGKIPWIGKLPGDIYIQRKSFSFYFPLTTCILISAIISLLLMFWGRTK